MHIPDGYLSPATTMPILVAMVPVWGVALRKVKTALNRRRVPLLALCAAFSFVIMMFNVPIIGGTSAHAVGATFIAILLGQPAFRFRPRCLYRRLFLAMAEYSH